MKVSENFTAEEFLSKETIRRIKSKGQDVRRYINKRLVDAAEGVRFGLGQFFAKKYADVVGVSMVGNTGSLQTRGFRAPWDNTNGASLSDHKFFNAFDSDVYLIYADGRRVEADYEEVVEIIVSNPDYFLEECGVTMVESPKIARTWLHFSIAWVPGATEIRVIKP